MSIVGTRPPLVGEVSLYELHHRSRLAIKPGITGMWQVSGRSDITDFEEVVDCKLFRAKFLKDIRFIPEMFIGEGFNFNVMAFQKAEKVIAGKRKNYYYRRDNPTIVKVWRGVQCCWH